MGIFLTASFFALALTLSIVMARRTFKQYTDALFVNIDAYSANMQGAPLQSRVKVYQKPQPVIVAAAQKTSKRSTVTPLRAYTKTGNQGGSNINLPIAA